ncbi:hypothetical protein [Paraburkholderia acidiphila]|uniref:Uncharacterized protein n=1 Tax=Paraburkholderia acidiphila TaxID=2571747 RepID=A0A7Z2G2R9_9BURK|nr:hypothetical protein [Paraburkholderia acidiphila]QGZ54014.1 hypothetical protein FAZ97_03275 [Paraburkholderia acidiphila]
MDQPLTRQFSQPGAARIRRVKFCNRPVSRENQDVFSRDIICKNASDFVQPFRIETIQQQLDRMRTAIAHNRLSERERIPPDASKATGRLTTLQID